MSHARTISARGGRPLASINSLKHTLSLVALAGARRNPVVDDPVTARVVNGLARTGTTTLPPPERFLDVGRVIDWLYHAAKRFVGAAAVAPSAVDSPLRSLTVAAIACAVPSRPSEIARLRIADIQLEQRAVGFGQPTTLIHVTNHLAGAIRSADGRIAANDRWLSRAAMVRLAREGFDVLLLLRDAKTDARHKGMRKRLEHPVGATASLALVVLARLVLLLEQVAVAHVVGATLCARLLPNRTLAAVSPDTVSHDLERVSWQAVGEKFAGRTFRSATASFLLAAGVPEAHVVAAGGWAGADALRSHYARDVPRDPDVLRRALRILPAPLAPPPRRVALAPDSAERVATLVRGMPSLRDLRRLPLPSISAPPSASSSRSPSPRLALHVPVQANVGGLSAPSRASSAPPPAVSRRRSPTAGRTPAESSRANHHAAQNGNSATADNAPLVAALPCATTSSPSLSNNNTLSLISSFDSDAADSTLVSTSDSDVARLSPDSSDGENESALRAEDDSHDLERPPTPPLALRRERRIRKAPSVFSPQ